jgi:hypothetical protein
MKTSDRKIVGGGLKESSITRSDMIKYLKENLNISINEYKDWYDSGIEVTISLGNDEIFTSRTSITLKESKSEY